jgi:hypothetical protein
MVARIPLKEIARQSRKIETGVGKDRFFDVTLGGENGLSSHDFG